MKNLSTTVSLGLVCLISTFMVRAAPEFTPIPGHEVEELLSITGEPSAYRAGIDAFDADEEGLYYISDSTLYSHPYEGSAQALFSYDTDVYGSFVCLYGDQIYFGESSFGTVRSIAKTGATAARLLFSLPPAHPVRNRREALEFSLANNYSCAFNSQSQMFISANPTFTGNCIYFWDDTGDPSRIAEPGGYSGSLGFDENDSLYYGCSTSYPAGPENIISFSSQQIARAVAGGDPLGLMEGELKASGIMAPSQMAVSGSSVDVVVTSSSGPLSWVYSVNASQSLGSASPSSLSSVCRFPSGRVLFLATDWSDYVSTIFRMDPEPLLSCPDSTVQTEVGQLGDPGSYITGIQAFDYDDEGNIYVFTETQYLIKNPEFNAQTLYEFPSPYYFGSFVRVEGDTVYFGESSTNQVLSVKTDGSQPARLLFSLPGEPLGRKNRRLEEFTLVGNYECDFDSMGKMFLSANPSAASYLPNNKIYCWTGQTGVDPVVVAEMGGYSGPLSMDDQDNLYYGFDSAVSPQVVSYTASQLDQALQSGTPLTPLDAQAWLQETGVSCSGMCWLDDLILYSSFSGDIVACAPEIETTVVGRTDEAASTYPAALRMDGDNNPAVLITSYGNYNSSVCGFTLPTDSPAGYGYFRPESVLWNLRGFSRFYFGQSNDQPLFFQTESGPSVPAVFRDADKLWVLRDSSRFYFGNQGDQPLPADYAGSGSDQAAFFRAATGLWKIRNQSQFYFGVSSDDPLSGAWTGEEDLPAFFRSADGLWKIRGVSRFYFGNSQDVALKVDVNGTGKETPAIFRPDRGLWIVRGVTRFYFGQSGDIPLAGNFSGDGPDQYIIYRPDQGLWKVRGLTRFYWGRSEDIPVIE